MTNSLPPVPHGNTAAQVNETALRMLQDLLPKTGRLLDVPCGEGEWLTYLKGRFPQLEAVGVDFRSDIRSGGAFDFHPMDVTQDPLPEGPFDVITSISGLVCFGNHLKFFREVSNRLAEDGVFLVTHDNHWTVRDRVTYLLFGTFKRFPVIYGRNEGNSQATSLMTVLHALENAGFRWEKIVYTSVRAEDYFWLPFAALLWIFQWIALRKKRSEAKQSRRIGVFPFRALYCRHYLILAKKNF